MAKEKILQDARSKISKNNGEEDVLGPEYFKTEAQKVEEEIGKTAEQWAAEEEERKSERRALYEAAGAEKATAEQTKKLRTEIGEEEEKRAERRALYDVLGPEKAGGASPQKKKSWLARLFKR